MPPACDLDKGSEEYRITLPLFGAVSSPCCVNLAMRGNAEDHQHEFSPKVVSTAPVSYTHLTLPTSDLV